MRRRNDLNSAICPASPAPSSFGDSSMTVDLVSVAVGIGLYMVEMWLGVLIGFASTFVISAAVLAWVSR